MYNLPQSSRSRTLSTLVQSPDAAAFDPLSASKQQLSQRPTRRPFVQGTTHALVLDHGDAPPAEPDAADEEPDPFQHFVGSALRGKHNTDRTATFSPASSTSSSASPDTPSSSRWFRSFSSDDQHHPASETPLSTPASSCCPTRSNSDEALACASSSPVDSAALQLNLAQLDLDNRAAQARAAASRAKEPVSAGPILTFPSTVASYPSPSSPVGSIAAQAYPFPNQYPSSASVQSQSPSASQSSNANFFAQPDLQRIRSVSLPQRSASEPSIHQHHQSPAHLVFVTESKSINAPLRQAFDVHQPSTSSDSTSDRGTLSPTTPTFLEEPVRPAQSLSSSPNRRRLALPKIDSSNLAAPSAPVLRPTNFWRHTSRSALNSPLAAPSANVHRRSSLINTGAAGSDECTQPDELLRECEGKVYADRIRVQELLI